MDLLDPALDEFGTPIQRERLAAVRLHGGLRAAARALGIDYKSLHQSIAAVKLKAAKRGYAPGHDYTHPVPDGFNVRGVSTYYDRDGKPIGQWVKSSADDAAREAMFKAACEAAFEEIPRLDPIERPAAAAGALCNLYTMTDCHVGMLAWGKETGEPWDLDIAEATLVGCFEQMVRMAPAAGTAIVYQGGDWNHFDSMTPVTPTHGYVLDADSRFSKIVKISIRMLRRLVDIALMKHDQVVFIAAEGNHDPSSSVWFRNMFAALYENEPRLRVDESPLPYYVYQHGQTMLGFHHGHLRKNEQLPLLFAAQFPKIWGGTTKRYAHTGHRHHEEVREHSGMKVTQHPTLAARDAYAARGGWIAERQVTAVTYHDVHGQVATNTVTPEMLAP